MAKAKSDVYIATQSGVAEVDGESFVFVKGTTRVRDGHPLLKAAPEYFEPIGDHVHYENSETASTKADGTKE